MALAVAAVGDPDGPGIWANRDALWRWIDIDSADLIPFLVQLDHPIAGAVGYPNRSGESDDTARLPPDRDGPCLLCHGIDPGHRAVTRVGDPNRLGAHRDPLRVVADFDIRVDYVAVPVKLADGPGLAVRHPDVASAEGDPVRLALLRGDLGDFVGILRVDAGDEVAFFVGHPNEAVTDREVPGGGPDRDGGALRCPVRGAEPGYRFPVAVSYPNGSRLVDRDSLRAALEGEGT
jgi:hypothetical protein